jgi:septal ring factor EnvC (AmiA/AmiB activator)
VRSGDAVAQVGASGGHEESGLYFELRRDGKPFDPLKWVVL